jgi:hypothetical protein
MFSNAINIHSISHLLFYMIFGYFFPNKWIIAIIMSFTWEIYEFILNIYINSYSSYGTEKLINRIADIIINLLGYYLGNLINQIIKISYI